MEFLSDYAALIRPTWRGILYKRNLSSEPSSAFYDVATSPKETIMETQELHRGRLTDHCAGPGW